MLCIACLVTILRGMVRSCLILLISCKIVLGGHFGSSACHLPLVASSSLGFYSISKSPFNMRTLLRFMRIYSFGRTFIVLTYFPRSHNHIMAIVDFLTELCAWELVVYAFLSHLQILLSLTSSLNSVCFVIYKFRDSPAAFFKFIFMHAFRGS